jgi:ABC-type branched-subunit amino acid transport system substrate-binding protein
VGNEADAPGARSCAPGTGGWAKRGRRRRSLAALLPLVLLAAACGSGAGDHEAVTGTSEGRAAPIDYAALGLWDDGPCDESLDPLVIGLMTVFESPVISLESHALALEASAEAFNARGGANGACIEVHACDDGATTDQSLACVREVDEAGVVATVNDLGTAGQAEVSAAMAEAGIPRVGSNVSNVDWADQNAYPLDASGTGFIFLMPQGLIEEGVDEIGIVRVDLAAAAALQGLLAEIYEGEATFPLDVPVPAGTTDYNQFVLAAEEAGTEGIALALGQQEGLQVVRAGQQLDTDQLIGSSLSTLGHATVAELGEFADQVVFLHSLPPATYDLPVYEALRADLAVSGEEALQPENLQGTALRSWVGLYALLWMIRDTGMTEFTREGITAMLDEATDVPMLDIFGGEDWTPALNHPGLFQRAGTNYWAVWRWDPDATAPGGLEGNFVPGAEISFDDVLCGTPFGGPEPC